MSGIRKGTILLAVFGLFLLLSGKAAAAGSDYGAWFPDPSSGQTSGVEAYDSQLTPFNDGDVSEQTSFACVTPDGSVLSPKQSQQFGAIVIAASDVYNGTFDLSGTTPQQQDTGNGANTNNTPPTNGGYQTGQAGMQAFLRNEALLLKSGHWVDYSQRTLERTSQLPSGTNYLTPTAGWSVALNKNAEPLSKQEGMVLANLIPLTASNPLELTSDLPEACAIQPPGPASPSFGEMFSSPGDFVTDTLLYMPSKLATASFNFLQPYAFRYTFFTPHTERGDLMWDIPASCVPKSPINQAYSAAQVASDCQGQTPLGYSQANISGSQPKAWFLQAAVFLQWMLSGTYFLILFTAAILYMVRGNRATSLNIMQLIPRLLLSIVLTMFAGFLIGAAITISNLTVQTIFNYDSIKAVGAVNTFMLQAGNIVGGPQILQQFASLVVSTTTVFFFAVFVLTSLVRQLLLVILIILAPLAAFCIINPRWQGQLRLYLRALAAILLLPVLLALVLKVGMSINPLVTDPGQAYGQFQGTLGLFLMLVTLWMMYKVIKLSKDYTLKGGRAFTDIWADRRELLGVSSPALEAARQQNDAPRIERPHKAEMIPADRATSTISDRKLITRPSSGEPPALPQQSLAKPSQNQPASPDQAFDTFQQGRRELGDRIPISAAKRYREGLRKAIGAETAMKGRRLTPEEVENLKKRYARKRGGKLLQQNGSWYLTPTEPEGFEGEPLPEASSGRGTDDKPDLKDFARVHPRLPADPFTDKVATKQDDTDDS